MLITNGKVYDTLKWIALVALPAVGTAYFAIAQIWGLPDANEVIGTIVAVDTGLGTILHISSTTYNQSGNAFDGTMDVVTTPEGRKTYSLTLNGDPSELQHSDTVVFQVNNPDKEVRKKTKAKPHRTAKLSEK